MATPTEGLNGGGAGADTDAIHNNQAGEINATTIKASPIDADIVLIEDSASGNVKRKATLGSLPVTLTVDTTDVANPPTDAELDAIFGTPATAGAGFTAAVDDNGAGANFYVVTSDGTNWWILTGAKAV